MRASEVTEPDGVRRSIIDGQTTLGVELGSSRIKAVLVGPDHMALATGGYDWENSYVDGLWTYSLDAVWAGVRSSYTALAADVQRRYDVELRTVGALGVSAMMHGYLAFDSSAELLVPFRTWRNTNTDQASRLLSSRLEYNIPHRWSVAHLFQALLDGEEHLGQVTHLTTLAGYLHNQLTGRQVLGVGDASGMFPIDPATKTYDQTMLEQCDQLAAEHGGLPAPLAELLPTVLRAGESAGLLSEEGARRLDPTGTLRPGVPLCPPEGDAGTGMVATNSVAPRTGNVSAGTSIFAMVVLERELNKPHRELDLVTTPAGDPVAMVHCNNGGSELGAWVTALTSLPQALGMKVDQATTFETLVRMALAGDPDCGGLTAYNYLSGEPITDLNQGRPLFMRTPDSNLTLANFMRTQLYASLATLRLGMDVLQKTEHVRLDRMFAHGGLFRTPGVAQRFLAAAIDTPVSVGSSAAEGGAWGAAVLAAFLIQKTTSQTLPDFLHTQVFANTRLDTLEPEPHDVTGFNAYMQRFIAGLPVERAASQTR